MKTKTKIRRTVNGRDVLELNTAESKKFARLVLNPPEPNPALRKAVGEYQRMLGR